MTAGGGLLSKGGEGSFSNGVMGSSLTGISWVGFLTGRIGLSISWTTGRAGISMAGITGGAGISISWPTARVYLSICSAAANLSSFYSFGTLVKFRSLNFWPTISSSSPGGTKGFSITSSCYSTNAAGSFKASTLSSLGLRCASDYLSELFLWDKGIFDLDFLCFLPDLWGDAALDGIVPLRCLWIDPLN